MQTTRKTLVSKKRPLALKRTRRATPSISPTPILKWVGGKTRLLGELSKRMPTNFGRYYEPFVGGGALFFRTAPARAVLGDYNADLINVYQCVANDVDKVGRKLAVHIRKHFEEHYYAERVRWNERSPKQTKVDRAAQFLYMNKTCFNGLWRVNSKGGFNVPIGRYTNPGIYDLQSLRAASLVLQKAQLHAGHYGDVVTSAQAGDFVYFDPPYHPITQTSNFTSYTAGSFNEDDQRELASVAKGLADKGCAVILSNNDTPFIREIYSGWNIDQVMCGRSINSKASKRGAVAEVIISNDF
ncbi:MAG: DNA adenine methylase [Kofleriaceae bacterium]|nr:DNA adenine methylase [Kofleriaceae bacterium]